MVEGLVGEKWKIQEKGRMNGRGFSSISLLVNHSDITEPGIFRYAFDVC